MAAFETNLQTTVQKALTSGNLCSSAWIPLSPLEEQQALMVMCHRELPELYSAKLVLSWRLTPGYLLLGHLHCLYLLHLGSSDLPRQIRLREPANQDSSSAPPYT